MIKIFKLVPILKQESRLKLNSLFSTFRITKNNIITNSMSGIKGKLVVIFKKQHKSPKNIHKSFYKTVMSGE